MFVDSISFHCAKPRYAVAMDQTRPEHPLTVYFDGGCPVCSREIAMYRKQAGAQSCVWVDAAACAESALGDGLSRPDALLRFHVRQADGRLVSGMRAFALLWRETPRMAWLGRLASFGPMPGILEWAYRLFLRVRPLWRGAPATEAGNRIRHEVDGPADPCFADRPGARSVP